MAEEQTIDESEVFVGAKRRSDDTWDFSTAARLRPPQGDQTTKPVEKNESYRDDLALSVTDAQETLGVEIDLSDIKLRDKEPVAHSLRGILDQLLNEYTVTRSNHDKDNMPDDHWPREQAFFRNEALRRIDIARRFFNQKIPENKLLQLAELLGDRDDLMQQLTPEYLVEGQFVPATAQELIVESLQINPHAIVPDIHTEFNASVNDSKVTFVGVDSDPIVTRNIAGMIRDLEDTKDVVLTVPFLPSFQPQIDKFLATGQFEDSDDPKRYPQLYEQFEGLEDIELLEDNISDAFREVLLLFPILQAARTKGIPVVACDVYGQEIQSEEGKEDLRRYKRTQLYQRLAQAGIEENYWDEDPNRDQGMFYMINNQVEEGKKVIAVTGRLDGQALFKNREIETGYPKFLGRNLRRTKRYKPSVALLAKNTWGDRVKSFIFENRLSNQKYASPGEQVSSVLFDAMRQYDAGHVTIGLRIGEEAIFNVPDTPKIVAADFYSPVYSD